MAVTAPWRPLFITKGKNMSTFDKLMQLDKAKVEELPRKVIKSERLAFLFGEDEPVDVTVRALKTREVQFVSEYTTDKKGNYDNSRSLDGSIKVLAMAIEDPDVGNEQLIKHFGAKNKEDLIEKLFQMECPTIATEVMSLSGATATETEAKN